MGNNNSRASAMFALFVPDYDKEGTDEKIRNGVGREKSNIGCS